MVVSRYIHWSLKLRLHLDIAWHVPLDIHGVVYLDLSSDMLNNRWSKICVLSCVMLLCAKQTENQQPAAAFVFDNSYRSMPWPPHTWLPFCQGCCQGHCGLWRSSFFLEWCEPSECDMLESGADTALWTDASVCLTKAWQRQHPAALQRI